MDPVVTETVITGMTKGELAAVVSLVVIGLGVLIGVLSYILNLHLKPLKDLPGEIKTLSGRVMGKDQLDMMMDNKILECQKNCPLRKPHLEKLENEG